MTGQLPAIPAPAPAAAVDRLSVRRAADRERIAGELELIAHDFGAAASRGDYDGPREIHINIKAARGLEVGVWLNGETSQPGIFILPWYVSGDAKLAEAFGYCQGANVSQHHRQKCTAVAVGVGELLAKVRAGLVAARDGTAFLTRTQED